MSFLEGPTSQVVVWSLVGQKERTWTSPEPLLVAIPVSQTSVCGPMVWGEIVTDQDIRIPLIHWRNSSPERRRRRTGACLSLMSSLKWNVKNNWFIKVYTGEILFLYRLSTHCLQWEWSVSTEEELWTWTEIRVSRNWMSERPSIDLNLHKGPTKDLSPTCSPDNVSLLSFLRRTLWLSGLTGQSLNCSGLDYN